MLPRSVCVWMIGIQINCPAALPGTAMSTARSTRAADHPPLTSRRTLPFSKTSQNSRQERIRPSSSHNGWHHRRSLRGSCEALWADGDQRLVVVIDTTRPGLFALSEVRGSAPATLPDPKCSVPSSRTYRRTSQPIMKSGKDSFSRFYGRSIQDDALLLAQLPLLAGFRRKRKQEKGLRHDAVRRLCHAQDG